MTIHRVAMGTDGGIAQKPATAKAVLWHEDANQGSVAVRALSQVGVFAQTTPRLPVGSQVALSFPVPGGKSFLLRGRVVRVVTERDSQRTFEPTGYVIEIANEKQSKVQQGLKQAPARLDVAPEPQISAHEGALVLVAEDDRVLAKILTVWLTKMGVTPLIAPNGKKAEELLGEHLDSVRLVIVDSLLPDTSGAALIAKMRDKTNAPIIATSAVFTRADAQSQVITAGASMFLAKPFKEPELRQAMMDLFTRAARRKAS